LLPYLLLLAVVVVTVLGALIHMNRLRIPGLSTTTVDAGTEPSSGDDFEQPTTPLADAAPDSDWVERADAGATDAASPPPDASPGVPKLSLDELELEKKRQDVDAGDDAGDN
jgi:hypothetical protein